MKRLCIIGAGGFGREVLGLIKDIHLSYSSIIFMESDEIFKSRMIATGTDTLSKVKILPLSDLKEGDSVVIAIGDSKAKKQIIKEISKILNLDFPTLIHPSAIIGDNVSIGKGTIICAGCIITCDIFIGDFVTLNIKCCVGHDSRIGNYSSFMTGATISGNVEIDNCVYVGTNASIRQKVSICDDTVIGMGAIVLRDINESGTYFGNPARKMLK